MTGQTRKIVLTAAFVSAAVAPGVAAEPLGSFRGDLIYKAVDNTERIVELVAPFSFEDPKGKLWTVPSGARVDGASIPQAFWSIIGGPFTGKYREASVVHDHYCNKKTETWQATHRVFYDGMLANGVDAATATTMYAAVYWGGPRWVKVATAGNASTVVTGKPVSIGADPADIVKLASRPGLSPEDIRKAIDEIIAIEATPAARARLETGCSLVVEPMANDEAAFAMCELDRESQKLLALRNVKILIDDVNTLLTANDSLLLPKIDAYIAGPSSDRWRLVQAASKKVNRLVSLTMVSVAQAEKELAGATREIESAVGQADLSKASVERVKRIGATRGLMLERTSADKPPDIDEMARWRSVYVALLSRLKAELPTLAQALQ
ncbi:MAG: DUF1353 domain-containing protein [Hyphomicrobiaceae bacterium]